MGKVEDAMNNFREHRKGIGTFTKLVYFNLLLDWEAEGAPKELKNIERFFVVGVDFEKTKSAIYELCGRGLVSLNPTEGDGWYNLSFKGKKRKTERKPEKEEVNNDNETENKIDEVGLVITYLNRVAETGFKEDSKSHRKYIVSAFKNGYTFADLKLIVNTKTKQWKGTEMARYLRPSTLFASVHLDEYLAEAGMEFNERPKQRQRDTRKGAR